MLQSRTTLEQLQEVLRDIQRRTGVVTFILKDTLEEDETDTAKIKEASPKRVAAAPATDTAQAAQWIPPGQSVTIQGFKINDGMIYVGRKLPVVKGSGKEPALIDPGLKVAKTGIKSLYGYELQYRQAYSQFTTDQRGAYLKWLAGGRTDLHIPNGFLLLFLFGIERRLLAEADQVNATERQALQNELRRLMEHYEGFSFRFYAARFLQYLEMENALSSGTWAPPPADQMERLPHEYNTVPVSLEMALSYFSQKKTPLSADYAWVWLQHDPEYTPRAVAQRAPDELKRLFLTRYKEQYPNGLKLTQRKTLVPMEYSPASHSFGQTSFSPNKNDGKPWKCVTRGPLNHVRELVNDCANELDVYSRYIARNGDETRDTLPALALLPAVLFANHPAVMTFEQWLLQEVEKHRLMASPSISLIPVTVLKAKWQTTLPNWTRGENQNLLIFLERLGWVVEPDLRLGGPLLSALPDTATIALTAVKDAPGSAFERPNPATWSALSLLLLAGKRGDGNFPAVVPEEVLPEWLPDYAAVAPSRLFARWHWLCNNPDEIKMPRRDVFAELLPPEREQLTRGLMEMALQAHGAQGFTPERTREMTKYFKVIGAEESQLFVFLHAAQTGQSFSGANDDFVTLQTSAKKPGFALPDGASRKPTRPRKTAGVALDTALIQRKVEETERVTALLSDLFVEESETASVAAPQVSVDAPVISLAGPAKASVPEMLQRIAEKPTWDAAEFAVLVRELGWLPMAAREAINEWAIEVAGDAVLEGDDPIEIVPDILRDLQENSA